MRLPRGTLTRLAEVTEMSAGTISEYVSTRMRPGGKRALILENACRDLGLDVSIYLWLDGTSDEIKAALINNSIKPSATPKRNNNFLKNLLQRKLRSWIN